MQFHRYSSSKHLFCAVLMQLWAPERGKENFDHFSEFFGNFFQKPGVYVLLVRKVLFLPWSYPTIFDKKSLELYSILTNSKSKGERSYPSSYLCIFQIRGAKNICRSPFSTQYHVRGFCFQCVTIAYVLPFSCSYANVCKECFAIQYNARLIELGWFR